jgi:hypothetical protein
MARQSFAYSKVVFIQARPPRGVAVPKSSFPKVVFIQVRPPRVVAAPKSSFA